MTRIEQIAALDALAKKATPGEWRVFVDGSTVQIDLADQQPGSRPCVILWTGFDGNDLSAKRNAANASLIVALVNAWRTWLREAVSTPSSDCMAVPREPTQVMLHIGAQWIELRKLDEPTYTADRLMRAGDVYKAMLSAAPATSQREEER